MNLKNFYYDMESDNFRLRQYTVADALDLFHLLADENVLRYFSMKKLSGVEEAENVIISYLDGIEKGTSLRWAIADRETDKLIGMAGFRRFDHGNFRAEIGYGLMPDYWGKGIAKKAVRLLVDHGFQILHLHTIEAQVEPENIGSVKVLESVGFRQEGFFKENYYFDGKFLDTLVFSIVNPSD